MNEKTVRLMAKLLDVRDTMRRIHGDKWPEICKDFSKVINDRAAVTKEQFLESAIACAKIANADGHNEFSITFLAAACEEVSK